MDTDTEVCVVLQSRFERRKNMNWCNDMSILYPQVLTNITKKIFNNDNIYNNKLFMVPRLIRARGTYKNVHDEVTRKECKLPMN